MIGDARYQRGVAKLHELQGDFAADTERSLKELGDDFADFAIGYGFGEIYDRPGLDNQQRQLVTIASLASQGGCEPQLETHIRAGRTVGLSEQAISEAITQLNCYIGFPKTINALRAAHRAFEQFRDSRT